MITKPIAFAIEAHLRKIGKFEGAKVCTRQNEDGSFEITKWEVHGINEPSEIELNQIISSYESNLIIEKQAKKNRKEAVLAKLGLQKSDLPALLELIDERNAE